MPLGEERYCRHGRPECTCLDDGNGSLFPAPLKVPAGGTLKFTVDANNMSSDLRGVLTGQSIQYGDNGIGGTITQPNVTTLIPNASQQWAVSAPVAAPEPCEHDIGPDLFERRDGVYGACVQCGEEFRLPQVPGGISFERAGKFLGRALSVDHEDDEMIAELMIELALLEREIEKEIERYDDAHELVKLARQLVNKRALHDAHTSVVDA